MERLSEREERSTREERLALFEACARAGLIEPALVAELRRRAGREVVPAR